MKRKKKSTKGFWGEVRELAILLLIAGLIRTVGFGLYQVPTGSMETTMLVGERFFADKLTPFFMPFKHGDIISFNDPLYPYSENFFMNFFQRYVWGPQNWTKRIIGLPGDTVRGVIEDGKPVVYRNGKKLDEPYLNKYPLIFVNMHTQRSYDPTKSFNEQPFYKMNPYEVQKTSRFCERLGVSPIVYPGTPLSDGQGSDVFYVHLGPNQYWVMGDNRLGSSDSRKWGVLDGKLIHGKILWRIFSVDSSDSWWIVDLLKHPIGFWQSVRWNRCFQAVS
jgi:signal peptidase I